MIRRKKKKDRGPMTPRPAQRKGRQRGVGGGAQRKRVPHDLPTSRRVGRRGAWGFSGPRDRRTGRAKRDDDDAKRGTTRRFRAHDAQRDGPAAKIDARRARVRGERRVRASGKGGGASGDSSASLAPLAHLLPGPARETRSEGARARPAVRKRRKTRGAVAALRTCSTGSNRSAIGRKGVGQAVASRMRGERTRRGVL